MNSHRNLNLSDEALSDLLAQPSYTCSEAVSSEVASTDPASTSPASTDPEVLALRSALRTYRTETLAWAERRSATQPSLAPRAKANRWAAVPQWSLATVAVVAVAAGVVHFAGYGAEDVAPAANLSVTTSAVAAAQPDDIAADNQLLGSIDKALRYDSVSPAAEFHAKPVKQSRHATQTEVTD